MSYLSCGGYPVGAENDPNAPWNSRWVEEECPRCEGTGGEWYNEDGELVPHTKVEKMTKRQKDELEFVPCDMCEGEGVIYRDLSVRYEED